MPDIEHSATAEKSRDTFGCTLGSLDGSETIAGRNIVFHHKFSLRGSPGQVVMDAGDGFLVGVSMRPNHRRQVVRHRHVEAREFGVNDVYVRPLGDDYRADLTGSFDFILAQVTSSGLARVADETDAVRVSELAAVASGRDDVLGGLFGSLFASIGHQRERSALFVDQLSVAVGIHLLGRYGNGRLPTTRRRRALSSRQAAIVQDMLSAEAGGETSLGDLAKACNMAPAALMGAFRGTFGQTPHQFVMQRRIERACALLLLPEMSLKDIALDCGYSDQSHFTRSFAKALGTTPGIWRRDRLS